MSKFLEDLSKGIKVPAEITQTTLEPTAKEIGDGLGNLFYLVFSPLLKAKIKKETEIRIFKENIEKELAKVPSRDVIEPELNVVGPALEAAKYYIEHEDLRKMFAKLIAASMNKTRVYAVHPSYVEVIKQLSPLDARILEFLSENRNSIGCGSIVLNVLDGQGGHVPIVHNFFPIPGLNKNNYLNYSASIDNLVRLGLVYIDKNRKFDENFFYRSLEGHQLVVDLQKMYLSEPSGSATKVELRRSAWEITQFGENFCSCCL
ncbi:DUF4393 domain-containing protein [Paenibacillus lautus]|uniref:DUF4393 domain-containing protein n=1 Tax=Paenibacillus lautus TaxID=1401 RepID=UPI002DBDE9BF|nr:DUF4393 domain-containing protein [Paenibacillus lautus]MEC0253634.1 DUF4393 domain-containing protein [Paenibacillus lautus]